MLTVDLAGALARVALTNVGTEYPYKLDQVLGSGADVRPPRSLHPAFFGSYDWHSCVHMHWLLARLLRIAGDLPQAGAIESTFDSHLSREAIAGEVSYLAGASTQTFERTYGWAWLLKLAEELGRGSDERFRGWQANLSSLADAFVARYLDWLPRAAHPLRTGMHANSAFGLAFALDYARAVGNRKLETLITERSRTYFGRDVNYPARWEPGGEDFFSAALMEADLMRRVMKGREFARWFHRFLPGIARNQPKALLEPAIVTDRTDPKLVHLDGLNLSRAWCMRSIATALPRNDPAKAVLAHSATAHAQAALPHVASGSYEGEHWLASFAVYMLTTPQP